MPRTRGLVVPDVDVLQCRVYSICIILYSLWITSNYRPISLTAMVGRLLEKLLRDRIDVHMERWGLIQFRHHGFTRGKSFLTNLVCFFDDAAKKIREDGRCCSSGHLRDFTCCDSTFHHHRQMWTIFCKSSIPSESTAFLLPLLLPLLQSKTLSPNVRNCPESNLNSNSHEIGHSVPKLSSWRLYHRIHDHNVIVTHCITPLVHPFWCQWSS